MTLKQLIKYLFSWRLATLLIAAVAYYALPIKDCCQNFGAHLDSNYLTNIWANFAGTDFLDLARLGYGNTLKPATYVFFPLFPQLINNLTQLTHNYLASGLIISHFSLVAALYFLYRLVRLDYKEETAKLTLILLMIFPTSFFFGSVYTESFFLLLVVLSFYFVRKKLFFLACLMALFASTTRFAGIFIWPALIWEMWRERKNASFVWLILPPLGLFSYMKFLFTKTGDALYFLKVTPDFGPNLVISKLVLLHQVFFRYAKMLIFSSHSDITFAIVLLEFIVGTAFLILTIYAFRKMRLSYSIYMLLSYLIPTFTGTFSSQPRYALTVFPAFILLALWYKEQNPIIKRFFVAVNIAFGAIIIALFTRGYFVG